MANDVFKFTNNGFDVTIVKKADVLRSIANNIKDEGLDVVNAIISQCEEDAANFINSDVWAGIPFMGNIRVPPYKQLEKTKEQQAIISTAKEMLKSKEFIMFKHRLVNENIINSKKRQYFNYVVSKQINKHRAYYKSICKEKDERTAKIHMFLRAHMCPLKTDRDYDIELQTEY